MLLTGLGLGDTTARSTIISEIASGEALAMMDSLLCHRACPVVNTTGERSAAISDDDSVIIDTYSGATKDVDSFPQEEVPSTTLRAGKTDAWFSTDKFMHFGVSAAIPGLTYYAYVYRLEQDQTQGKIISISLTGLIGLGKEIYDKKTKGHFSWKDLVWDALGLTAGYFIFIHEYE